MSYNVDESLCQESVKLNSQKNNIVMMMMLMMILMMMIVKRCNNRLTVLSFWN